MRLFFRSCCVFALAFGGLAASRQEPAATQPTASVPDAASPPASQSQPATTAPVDTRGQRVVLRVNRNQTINGVIELEDDNVLVARDLHGNLHSLAKPRITQIVRLVEPKPGQTGVVRMMDGQIREGVIIEDTYDYVIVEIEGIRANLKRATVDFTMLEPTVEERFAEYKRALQPGNYDAHLTLCRWLYEQKRYELARVELLDILEHVEMPEAKSLLNIVEAQLALEKPPAAANDEEPAMPEPMAGDEAPAHPADAFPQQLLTDADVNLIRVYEIDFDRPPHVTITPDTVRSLIEKYGTNPLVPASQVGRNALFRAAADNPLQIVRLMFELRARDLYDDVQVNNEPYSLNQFRRRVHDTWLINSCATTACHGSPFAGRFFLHRRNFKDDRVRYTNLLILDRLELDPEWPLINYDKPEDSLIIQYAMPRESARKPHPRVRDWKPVFNPTNARLKEDAVEWIRAMMMPRPDYPVEYEPPLLGAEQRIPVEVGDNPSGRVPR